MARVARPMTQNLEKETRSLIDSCGWYGQRALRDAPAADGFDFIL